MAATLLATAFFAAGFATALLALAGCAAGFLALADLAVGAFAAVRFFSSALDGNASCTPFLAALERFRLVDTLAAGLAGVAAALGSTIGLAAPSLRRTGLSPQSSSRW